MNDDGVLIIEYRNNHIDRFERGIDDIIDCTYFLSGDFLILQTKRKENRGCDNIWIIKENRPIPLKEIKSFSINNKTKKIDDYEQEN